MKQTVFINLYRCGVYYHRQGNPDTTNLHGGDLYVTKQAALENAEPDRGYITTISAEMEVPAPLFVNPHDSVPTPLSVTQRNPGALLPIYAEPAQSIDTSERETAIGFAKWQHKYGSPSSGYKPSHGGYPVPHDRVYG